MQVQPAAKRINARLEFAFVYPDKRGRNVMRLVGVVTLPDTQQFLSAETQHFPLAEIQQFPSAEARQLPNQRGC